MVPEQVHRDTGEEIRRSLTERGAFFVGGTMREYKSFYKTVGGNEGSKCKYPTRLDSYGCGCMHNCEYCYARSLLEFRGLWRPEDPAVADLKKVRRKLQKIPAGTVLRLGGMTDCFQPIEKYCRITHKIIQELNRRMIGYLIVTKSALVADDEYIKIYDPKLCHIQITITATDDEKALEFENASRISERIKAVEKLQRLGFDVSVRLSPFIPEYIDFDKLNAIRCDKILVEFLRSNGPIRKTFPIDYSEYTVKESGYRHLPLEKKKEYLSKITGFKEVTVCEDETEAYEYWKHNFNPDPEDCCNLRKAGA